MRRTTSAALALAAALAAGSCGEDRFVDAPDALERVTTVELTDDPFPYDSAAHVNLFVVRIDVSEQPDTSPANPAWHTVATPNRRYDLIELTGGATDTLGGAEIPAGVYRAVRMVIDTDSSSITAKDGGAMPVSWQSSAGRPTLYALVEDPMLVPQSGARIVIDFDVGRSFLCNAPCTSFVFSPVFRAVNRAATGGLSGRVRGDTLAFSPEPISDVTVTVYSGNPALSELTWGVRATGKTDADGNFRILYLRPGTYILRADAPRASSFTPGVLSNVVVQQGAITQGSDIVLPRLSGRHITLWGVPGQLMVGDSLYITAWVEDSAGQVLPGVTFSWASLDTTVARVFADCCRTDRVLLLALAAGTARFQVTGGGLTSVFTIPIVPWSQGPITAITLAPQRDTLHLTDSLYVTATARDSLGLPVRTGFTWSTSDSLVARVYVTANSAVAILLPKGPGAVALRANAAGVTGTMAVTVIP